MTIGNAIFQGMVQGLTEFLPVSSSGHLSLVQYFTGQSGESGVLFSILLHLGTLLAVCIAFYKTLIDLIVEFFTMLGDIPRGRFSWKNANPHRRMVILLIISLLPMVIAVVLKDFYSGLASDNGIVAEGVCFLITSALLFLSVKCVKGHKNASGMTVKDALAIGTVQAIAPLPGVSRSGSTISVGLMMGLERDFAVAFSFIMGVPAVLAANILEISDAMGGGSAMSGLSAGVIAAGFITSLAFGLLAIWMVRILVASDRFRYFAWYTLILGVIVVSIGLYENFAGHPIQAWVMGMLG